MKLSHILSEVRQAGGRMALTGLALLPLIPVAVFLASNIAMKVTNEASHTVTANPPVESEAILPEVPLLPIGDVVPRILNYIRTRQFSAFSETRNDRRRFRDLFHVLAVTPQTESLIQHRIRHNLTNSKTEEAWFSAPTTTRHPLDNRHKQTKRLLASIAGEECTFRH